MDNQVSVNKTLFPALTGIRAIAAFMVFFSHVPFHLGFIVFQYIQFSLGVGVTLFFVLSGFLITYRYYTGLALSGQWFRVYFTNRFARVYPVYFLLTTIVILAGDNYGFVYIIENYTLTHVFSRTVRAAIGPSWTLTVEESFYILAPFIMLLVHKKNIWWPLLIYICILSIVFLYCDKTPNIIAANKKLLMVTIVGRFFEFFVGIFTAWYILNRGMAQQKRTYYFTTTGIGGIVVCICCIASTFYMHGPGALLILHFLYAFVLPFPAILLYYGLCSENTLLRKLLSGNTLDLFGKASYSFYLLHMPIFSLFKQHMHQYHGMRYNLYVIFLFALTLALSIIIYKYFEAPANRHIKKWLLKR